MFRITYDPSSGSLVQYLAKITTMVLSCPLIWTWSELWQHIVTRYVCIAHCLERYLFLYNETHTHRVITCYHYTDLVHVNGHDRNILVILAKYCTRLPDDGSSVIRNVLEHF